MAGWDNQQERVRVLPAQKIDEESEETEENVAEVPEEFAKKLPRAETARAADGECP